MFPKPRTFNDQRDVLFQITLTGVNLAGKQDYPVLHRRKTGMEEIGREQLVLRNPHWFQHRIYINDKNLFGRRRKRP